MNKFILSCPRCRFTFTWDRDRHPEPGKCRCGAWAPWRVLKEWPKAGFVRVLSHQGVQELHGPGFYEDPNGWVNQ